MKDVYAGLGIVYGLVDPRTGLVFYVGQSTQGLARPRLHMRPSERGPKHAVISELRAVNLKPEIVILETVAAPAAPATDPYWKNASRNPTALHESERWWIALGRALGWPLTNATEGGQGRRGFAPSKETRARISAAKMGHSVSQETREILRSKNTQYRHTADARARISMAMKGRRLSEEVRANMRAGWALRKARNNA